jgi:hypothetical protein
MYLRLRKVQVDSEGAPGRRVDSGLLGAILRFGIAATA